MAHVCPWWFAYTFDNPLRQLFHDREIIFAPYVRKGMRVADIGCGFGYFSLGLARKVQEGGKVFAVDIQPQMLRKLGRRAEKEGFSRIIKPILCRDDALELPEPIDFALAFWMVHEVPDPENLFRRIYDALKPEGILLFTEPVFHVRGDDFRRELAMACKAGFTPIKEPKIWGSHSAVLGKSDIVNP